MKTFEIPGWLTVKVADNGNLNCLGKRLVQADIEFFRPGYSFQDGLLVELWPWYLRLEIPGYRLSLSAEWDEKRTPNEEE